MVEPSLTNEVLKDLPKELICAAITTILAIVGRIVWLYIKRQSLYNRVHQFIYTKIRGRYAVMFSEKVLEDLFAMIKKEFPEKEQQEIYWKLICSNVEDLANNPELGKPGRVEDTFDISIPETPFILTYTILEDTKQVAIIYASVNDGKIRRSYKK